MALKLWTVLKPSENDSLMNPRIKRTDFGAFVMVDDTHLSRWVEHDGRLDHAHNFIEQFRRFIPLGGTVIDAGTCIGDHTVTYANIVGPEGQVIGFEANPDAFECCSLNLAMYPNTRIINIGLSNRNGVLGIEIDANVGASHLSSGVGPNIEHVKLAPLDNYIDYVKRCDFMKVDIEGSEFDMLLGAKEFLKRYSPAILMEINDPALALQGATRTQVFEALATYGYSWTVAGGLADSPQYDILAVKD